MEVTRAASGRVPIVSLSATPYLNSTKELSSFVGAVARQGVLEDMMGELESLGKLLKMLMATEALQGRVHSESAAYQLSLAHFQEEASSFGRRIGIKFVAEDRFRGFELSSYKKTPLPDHTLCRQTRYLSSIAHLCQQAKDESHDLMTQLHDAAVQGVPEPELERYFDRLVPLKGAGARNFSHLATVATFPVLAQYYARRDAELPFDQWERDYFGRVTGGLENPRDHPLYRQLVQSLPHSPKLQVLFGIVEAMMADQEKHGRMEEVVKKKAVVFSVKPLVAQLVAVALRIRFPDLRVVY